MSRYVIFLRAVNVAGHARVGMHIIRDVFAAAGCRNVKTFIQTGNVLFDANRAELPQLLDGLRPPLHKLLGEEPQLLLRSLRQLDNILLRAPFDTALLDGNAKLYVGFLARLPRSVPSLPLAEEKEGLALIAVKGCEAYIVSRRKPGGMFGFPNNFLEAALGVPATCRNVSTLTRLVAQSRQWPGDP